MAHEGVFEAILLPSHPFLQDKPNTQPAYKHKYTFDSPPHIDDDLYDP